MFTVENMNIDSEAFQKELSSYSDDDLELIIETQKELFSTEEMQMLEQELEKRKQAKQAQIIASLPKEIICPKCDGINPFDNNTCQFCGWVLDKKEYYGEDWNLPEENIDESAESDEKSNYTFHYVISFLIPLVGFIVGAIMLGKDDSGQRSVGKVCIICGIISIVITYLLWGTLISGALF